MHARAMPAAILFALAVDSSALAAQNAVVRLQVTDSAYRHPVPGADVYVVRGLNTVVASGAADSAGRARLAWRADSGAYQLVVRAIGYARASQFFVTRSTDTTSMVISLARLPQQLSTVTITAEESEKHRRLSIDADAIASSTRPINNAADVITKLRPDMITGLITPMRPGPESEQCSRPGVLSSVWVNGRWIDPLTVPIDAMARMREQGTVYQTHAVGRRPDTVQNSVFGPPRENVSPYVVTVLSSIKPEHIADMTFHDCTDMSVGKIHGEMAVFVALKPGVGFEPGRGSYVIEPGAEGPLASRALASLLSPPRIPAYRTRLVGVFDVGSGAPLDSCKVTDLTTGTWIQTSSTGTLSLAFLDEGPHTLHIVRAGYAPLDLPVVISPADSSSIAVALSKTKH